MSDETTKPRVFKVGNTISVDTTTMPDNVTGVTDTDGAEWHLNQHGHWHTNGFPCDGRSCGGDPLAHTPLTVTAVREAEPVILALPTVPPGTVALVTVDGGDRWLPHDRMFDVDQWINEGTRYVLSLASLLEEYGPVRVELREPRTWPKLDGAPDDVRAVRGASGQIYVRSAHPLVQYVGFVAPASVGAERESMLTASLSHWQEIDGPLTEIIDGVENPAPWETR